MLRNVPVGLYSIILGLFDTSIVVGIFEQKNAPVLISCELKLFEHGIFLDFVDHKAHVVLSIFDVSLSSVDPDLVKICVDYFAAELSELVQKS